MSLGNIRVVLVRPYGAANVGAAARAMKNMGLHELVLVRPALPARAVASAAPSSQPSDGEPRSEPIATPFLETPGAAPPGAAPFWAKAMAVHADDVLSQVRRYNSLEEAVAGCSLVVGTTCRDGLYRAAAESPRSVAPRIVAAAAANHVALVFGPEDHGLSNEDLKACHQLIAIPSDPGYASLNLAQAVMVCCYELFVAATGNPENVPVLAPAERLAFMFERLQSAFLSIGFLHADNPDHIMFAFRRMLGRAQMEERDVRILLALARQIEWYGSAGWRLTEQNGLCPDPLPEGSVDKCDTTVPRRSPGNEFPGSVAQSRLKPTANTGLGVPFRGLFNDSAGEFIPRRRAGTEAACSDARESTVPEDEGEEKEVSN